MELRPEQLHYMTMRAEVHSHPDVKLIRATTEFAAYLSAVYIKEFKCKVSDVSNGIYGHWAGVPIIIDNTIQHPYYELEY